MANLTIEININGATRRVASPEVADATLEKFVEYIFSVYPQVDGNGDPLDFASATNQQKADAFEDWANGVITGAKDQTRRFDEQNATETAVAGVTDIY